MEEMTEVYITKWNKKVTKNDEVYILGDFSFYHAEETIDILKRLNGKKYLIKGNHDHMYLNDKKFDKSLFQWIEDIKTIKDGNHIIALCHYPIQVWDRKHYGSLHFYGHIHSNVGKCKYRPMKYDIPNSYNVGIDIWGEPVSLYEILTVSQKRKRSWSRLWRKFIKHKTKNA